MPRKKDSRVIGRCECPTCGETMSVLQNTRNYLYTNCHNCGCDQRNGAKHQTYLWYKTEWLDGSPPEKKPHNVDPDPEPKANDQAKADPEDRKKQVDQDDQSDSIGLGWLLVPLGVVAAIAFRR